MKNVPTLRFFHALAVNCSDVLSETSRFIAQTRLEVVRIQLVTHSGNIWCSAANDPNISSNMSYIIAGKCPHVMLEISGLSHQKYSVFFYHECLNILLNTSAGFTLTNPEVQNSGLTWQLPRHQLWDLNFISLCIGCKLSKHHPVLLPQTRLEVFLIQLVTHSVSANLQIIPLSRRTCPVLLQLTRLGNVPTSC